MHSIASVKSASGAANYFAKDDFVAGEYYTDEKAGDVSLWGGAGAAAAGLTGAVAKETFAKVLSGELPSGDKVDVREGRRPGFDLTFSAPKSVSVMAYIAGDKRILGPEGAQTKAVQQTMAWVEKNIAAGRITKDGKTETVKTGNLVYALFQHDTSRALDAHVISVYINRNEDVSVPVPPGTYRMKIIEGDKWHGLTNWFGSSTTYETVVRPMIFDHRSIQTIDLHRSPAGNLHTSINITNPKPLN